jgi:hypothetical protein
VQTADLVTIRPPWLRGARRTPDAARERLVGARVPWITAEPMAREVAVEQPKTIVVGSVGSMPVAPAPVPLTSQPLVSQPPMAPIPAAPALAPQVAAWLGRDEAPAETPRFAWAPAPGAGTST